MIKFKEKIPTIYKLGVIVSSSFVTIPFLIIVFSNSANLKFLPIVLGWSIFCILVALYRFQLMCSISLSNNVMLVPNRGYHKHISDVNQKVKILNGRFQIPYNEIEEIKIRNRTIYLKYKGLSNNVVLHPIDIEKFILILKENLIKLGLNISIQNEVPKENLLEFKNDVLTNKPTLTCLAIFLLIPNLVGLFHIITGADIGAYIFMSFTILVTIIFFVSIFECRTTIILSNEEIIETNQYGDIDFGAKKIAYKDIIKIIKTNWRVDIETRQNDNIFIVSDPAKLNVFYSELQNKVSN